ncbi:MFS transporter, partial [Burkholderia pseudomallei]
LMKGDGDIQQTLTLLALFVTVSAFCALAVRFSAEHNAREAALRERALAASGVTH